MKSLSDEELSRINGGCTPPNVWDGRFFVFAEGGPDAGCDPYLPPGEYTSILTGQTVTGCGGGPDGGSSGSSGSSGPSGFSGSSGPSGFGGSSNPITCYTYGNVTVVNNRGRGGRCSFEP